MQKKELQIKEILVTIFFTLKEEMLLSEFYRSTAISDLYSSVRSFITSLNNLAFGQIKRKIAQTTLTKMKTIIKEYANFQSKSITNV